MVLPFAFLCKYEFANQGFYVVASIFTPPPAAIGLQFLDT